jgi:hypothetical protein
MTVKNSSSGSARGGCGCGGHAASASSAGHASPCSCGGSCGCESCASQGFTRPRFFAGQLLTEEDLDLLSEYIVGKSRLRNRTLFGDGVVCGLQVTCNPCGGGTVIVHPGSAIDCCGNDIVVPCEQKLDINAMVRQLRIDSLGGYDCGDPCADSKAQGSGKGAATDENPTGKKASMPREFCLYLKYCEELTDPVAAYSTDEACGAQACEPTRVKEGFRFELRCPAPEKAPDDFLARAIKCLGDSEDVMKTVAEIHNMQASATAVKQAAVAAQATQAITFSQDDAKQLNTNIGLLKKWAVTPAGGAVPAPAPSVDAATLSDRMRLAVQTASLTARFSLAQKVDVDNRDQVARQVKASQPLLEGASATLTADITRLVPDSLDKTVALANLQVISAPQAKGPLPITLQQKLLLQNVVYSVAAQNAQAFQLKQIQQKLLDKLDATMDLTNCKLREQLKAVVISVAADDGLTEGQANEFGASIEIVGEALLALIANCLCLAVNPPCQPCDDPGVLLACVCVQDCSVVDICNMSRQFVLAAPAFRYWYPVRVVGKLLELACCGSECGVPWYATYGAKLAEMFGEKTKMEFATLNVGQAPVLSPAMTSAVPLVGSLFTPKTIDTSAFERFTRAAIDAADIARIRLGTPATVGAFGAGALAAGAGVRRQVETATPSIEDEVNKQVEARLKPFEDRLKNLEAKTPRRGKAGLPIN